MPDLTLPIEEIREEFTARAGNTPIVITAPTGSGKSTQVPRWCAQRGPVLVVEPRRVACRGLAQFVARLEACLLGSEVGYAVRDDHRHTEETRILFATPGVVLGWLARDTGVGASTPLQRFATVVLDEFHERRLDVDLILAQLLDVRAADLVVMSATMDAQAVADHTRGVHLRAGGRLFPVDVQYAPGAAFLPDPKGLEARVVSALKTAGNRSGDVLVFLPGKAEIARCRQAVGRLKEYECLVVHGGLALKEQSRVFESSEKRRAILSTNVAETSITIPSVGTVVDSGLVRRTRYHNGRGYLTLVPIAMDSAQQRAGRAGRTGPGLCVRLWDSSAILTQTTPPEMRRESLVPLVLAAAACGRKPEELPFLEPPADYALESARADLLALRALSEDGTITQRGAELFSLPLDPFLGALLVEGEKMGMADEAIDLVAALSVGRPMFVAPPQSDDDADKFGLAGCDGQALVRAVRKGDPRRHGISPYVLQEARSTASRLRRILSPSSVLPVSQLTAHSSQLSKRLAMLVLAADPRGAYIARRRKKGVFWSNGGTEMQLARDSFLDADKVDALVALDVMALGQGHRKTSLLITRAIPVKIGWLVEADLGERQVARADVSNGKVVAVVHKVYAGKVIAATEEEPVGELARAALTRLFVESRVFLDTANRTRERLDALALYRRLDRGGLVPAWLDTAGVPDEPAVVPSLEEWTLQRLAHLGFERGQDLQLLTADDLLAADLPNGLKEWLDRQFPRTVDLGDAVYKVVYDLGNRLVTLEQTSGQRATPPTAQVLPSLSGFAIKVKSRSRTWVVR